MTQNLSPSARSADTDVLQFQSQRRIGQAVVTASNRGRFVQQLPDTLGAGAGIGECLHDAADTFDAKHQGGGNQQGGDQFTDS
ncbi:hypothetical protein D3C87_1987290 [compost metagenome]